MNKFKALIVLILVSLGVWVGISNYITPESTIVQTEAKPVEEEEIMGVLPENPRKLTLGLLGGLLGAKIKLLGGLFGGFRK